MPDSQRPLTMLHALRGQAGLVIGPLAIIEDGVLSRQIGPVGPQPSLGVFAFDGDDASIMTSRRDLRRRLVSHCCETQEVRLPRRLPTRPETGHQHLVEAVRLELQDQVFWLLVEREGAALSL